MNRTSRQDTTSPKAAGDSPMKHHITRTVVREAHIPTGDATTVPADVVQGARTLTACPPPTELNRESRRRVQFSRREVQTFMEEGGE